MTAVCRDIHGLRAAGATYREISDLTGLTLSQISYRLGNADGKEAPHPHRRKGTTQRACMCCGKTFLSEGAHNRLCGACRNRSAGPYDTPATVRYR